MAPPKPTTPPNPNPNPNPSSSSSSGQAKKNVTPAQVAFLVERYLADNGFHSALAAFRSDAAHLFSPNRNKPTPKGLLPLAEILHAYIDLKEKRVAIDSAMHAMHSLVSTYYAASTSPTPAPMNMNMMMLPPLPLPPHAAQPSSPPLVPPLFVASSSSPPPLPVPAAAAAGAAGHASPVIHHYAHASTSVLVHKSSDMPTSLPTSNKKRKPAKRTASASKRSCIAPATTSDAKGKPAALAPRPFNDTPDQNRGSAAQPVSAQHSAMPKLPVQTSSVAKSLFRPLAPPAHSSPCTPQQSHPIQDQPAAYSAETPLSAVANAHAQAQQDIASSQCSIVSSSKTVIVSPLKGGTYYAVERSYHVSSPLKSTTHKSTKRDHVKGKLNFDSSDVARPAPIEQSCEKASTSSGEDKQDDFDIDFTNLDLFDGEFPFSELLLDFDLDNDGIHCQNPSTSAEVQRLDTVSNSCYVTVDPVLPDSVKPLAADATEDFSSQGATSVTSVRAITKRIKIVSPVKGRTTS